MRYQPPMLLRRLLVVLIVIASALALDALMWATLAPGGWTPAKAVIMASFALATPWVGFYVANGLIGFAILLRRGDATPPWDAEPDLPAAALPMTALAVTVRNEDIAAVMTPLLRLMDGLRARGVGERFRICILSDTTDPDLAAAEASAARAAGAFHRRRMSNEGYKAGNVMEFLDHHALGFEAMVMLDADSVMSPRAVLRLVQCLVREPHLAIVQHLTVGLPARSPFPRLFQYGMRVGMRSWATGLSWWQGDESAYWGHNAAIRIAPFREHARLPTLPDGRHILSHDQVEAALLAGAGWGVRLIPEEDGSAEANPPAFPEFIRRDTRWLAGNLEYVHLLRLPTLRPMGRWQLIQAIALFGCSPLYLVLLLAAGWAAATDRESPFPVEMVLATAGAWVLAIYSPKLLCYLELLLSGRKAARYGGRGMVLAGASLEMAFALVIDPIAAWYKTITVLRLIAGRPSGWAPQNRTDRGVGWREATSLLWPQTVLGVVLFACFASAGWVAVAIAAPLAGGLLVAIPFCVWTADPRLGEWLRRRRIAAIPEELEGGG